MKTNIQGYPDAVMLTEWSTKCANPADEKTRYIYVVKSTGMLYEVDPADGTITGQKYILDISFERVIDESTLTYGTYPDSNIR